MSVTPRAGLVALATAGSLLLISVAPASALAADHHPAKAKHPKVRHFSAHGIIVSASGDTAVLMARTVADHKGAKHNQLITLKVAPTALHHRHKAAPTAGLVVGNELEATGTETGSGDSLVRTVTHAVQHAMPAHVFVGVVVSIDGALIRVAKAEQPSDDPHENDNGLDGMRVDVSKATVTVDGAPGALAVGQTVAILGEGDHDAVLAAAVYAYTVAPSILAGEVSAVDGTEVTVERDDVQVVVDLAGTALVVNGNPASDLSNVVEGSKILVLGSTDSLGVFTPGLAFVFNHGDRHPVGHNPDED